VAVRTKWAFWLTLATKEYECPSLYQSPFSTPTVGNGIISFKTCDMLLPVQYAETNVGASWSYDIISFVKKG
jgi:hypothetical protein